MSKSRVSSTRHSSRESSYVGDVIRFAGLSLGGGKADKACLALIEYYPKHHKVFLAKIFERIKSDEDVSADIKIHEILEQYHGMIHTIALDSPWRLPNCLQCLQKCPGYESCEEPHIRWMWDYTREKNEGKKPKKLFTPYTQRAVELHLASQLEEPFHIPNAMGANAAPMLARAAFILRRLELPAIEVYPRLSVWRIGNSLHVLKSQLRSHKHAATGEDSRRGILKELSEHNVAFVYDQDRRLMVENNHAFEAFICAITAFLEYMGQTEPRPRNFPKSEDWISFPKEKISWKF
ncbi:MAG: DUF429 domain-containing protein [Bdellovibrionaceae bacterium]|nr:DUF429 domain-containing protein [Pseudobdellovibrionaceae bacterium]